MADCWVDIQVSFIAEINHSSVCWYRRRLQRGFNFWPLRQKLLTKYPSNLPPPVFARNCHQSQPTFLYVVIGSYLIEVSIADFWDSYYQPTNQILPNLPPHDIARNYHQAQPTVLSVGIVSDVTKVSIDYCWYSYYRPNTPSILYPLFLRVIIIRHNPQFCPLE